MSQSQSINTTATLEPSGPDHTARPGAIMDNVRQHRNSNNIYSNPDLASLGTLESDLFIRTEPVWEDHRHDSNWAVASVNVNSLPPHATSAEDIVHIMTHLRLDILAIQETKKYSSDMEKLCKHLAFNGSSNNAVREHTQRVADTWIQQIVSNGHKAIVLGNFNERLADGGANVSMIGCTLMDRKLFEETHRNVRRTLSEGTSVSRGGTPRSWINFIFVTTNLGSGVCQAVVAIESTELNEDHRLIMAEVAVSLGQPGAASQAPARRPRLNIAGASEAQQMTFLAKLDTISAADTDIDSFIWKTAEGAFQKMSTRRKAAQLKSCLCRASQMRKHVWRYMGGEDLQCWRWGKIVEECDTLITDGLPTAIREKCREVASILPPPNWEGVQKTLTNFIRKHLSRTVKSEAVGRHYRKIAKATHWRAELMNGHLGRMVLVIQTPSGTEIYADPEWVEAEASRHFQAHFTHPSKEAIEVTEEWAEEYRMRPGPDAVYFRPITTDELDEWIDRTPKKKAPGPSGVSFELLRMTGDKFRVHLLATFNKALETAEIPASWT
ncbi:hypothetical protein IW146_002647 [Coemansia sp. RSA 922]|nr:hypothetical protein IW146_002647 [Coemansia sp. RSA 922]